MNLLHDLPAGTKDEMTVIVEIPRGSKNKYEVDKKTGIIALDRVLHTAQDYPFDYGFIPQTLWEDGDALDVILLTTYPVATNILVRARPIGILRMTDGDDNDDKVIAVPINDPRFEKTLDISDVNTHKLKEIEHFFMTYKQLQKKVVTISGFDGKKAGEEAFNHGIQMYNAKHT